MGFHKQQALDINQNTHLHSWPTLHNIWFKHIILGWIHIHLYICGTLYNLQCATNVIAFAQQHKQ
jgi:hypothetical protein